MVGGGWWPFWTGRTTTLMLDGEDVLSLVSPEVLCGGGGARLHAEPQRSPAHTVYRAAAAAASSFHHFRPTWMSKQRSERRAAASMVIGGVDESPEVHTSRVASDIHAPSRRLTIYLLTDGLHFPG